MQKAVLFDWDGVLVDSTALYFNVYCQIAEHFHKALSVHNVAEFRSWYDSTWENNYYEMGFVPADLPAIAEFVHQHIDYTPLSLFPGVPDMLANLAGSYRLAIVSTTPADFILNRLRADRLDTYIECISGQGSCSDKAARLAATLRQLNCHEAVMIGDTPADIAAGQANNIPTIGATYGWITPERLRASHPTLAVDDPLQMERAIRSVLH